MILYDFVKILQSFFCSKKTTAHFTREPLTDNRKGCPYGLCVIIGLRFFVLQKIVRVRIPLTICKKITAQCLSHHTFILGGEQGIFRRTAVRLRIASLFNHGLSNSPPDCFHRQSRPSLLNPLLFYQQKIKGTANAIPFISGGEQGTRLTSFAEKFATQTVLL